MSQQNDLALQRLVEVMAALRTPRMGCPWDLEQTFATIAPYTIEEAYEVADAIERRDLADLEEELGDLLLQVVYHARLAEEERAFDLCDVIAGITKKMIRRHPHVFGDEAARSAGAAKDFWETIKAEEKVEKAAARARLGGSGAAEARQSPSVLDNVPLAMPALTRAIKLQAKAAKVGFDWPDTTPVLAKIREELGELEAELAMPPSDASCAKLGAKARVEEEYGDLLFVVANLARHLDIDAEAALRGANQKFIRRFQAIEQRLAQRGKAPETSDLAEMDKLWNEVKAAEKYAKGS
jgi:nucleoside triphosphate diphosphatase